MTKERKLHRYRRKDYDDFVAFPVEIVGRDGVVRRYDFEASVRLYERRASVAEVRFHDADLARAEVAHCHARIAQLRRSYLHHEGWDGSGEGPRAVSEALAAHAASLLHRTVRAPGRLDVSFSALQGSAGVWRWAVSIDGLRPAGGLLLEAISRTDDEGAAADARRQLDLALAGRMGGDAERLIAETRAQEWTIRLTGRADDVALLAAVAPAARGEGAPGVWEEIVDLVRRGDLPTAYLRCRWLAQRRPWHRDAYALGAQLALGLGRPGDAEDLAYVGLCHLPDDPELWLARARARWLRGDLDGAVRALDTALVVAPGLEPARVLRRVAALRAGDVASLARGAARALFPVGAGGAEPGGPLTDHARHTAWHATAIAVLLVALVAWVPTQAAGAVPWAVAVVVALAMASWGVVLRRFRALTQAALLDAPLDLAERLRRNPRPPTVPAPARAGASERSRDRSLP